MGDALVQQDDVRRWMRAAVAEGKKSIEEDGRSQPAPAVGVALVHNGELLGTSHRGATGSGEHAEYGLLKQFRDRDLTGATVFTTLEPCSRRNHPKRPCAEHLIERGIAEVFIGMYDPNPRIYREGWRMLRDAGVRLRDFTPELRAEVTADNRSFVDSFRLSIGATGRATFDYKQHGGRHVVQADDVVFTTHWGERGGDSVYAQGAVGQVAKARYARDFAEIDDPGALDWSFHAIDASEGEIVVCSGRGRTTCS